MWEMFLSFFIMSYFFCTRSSSILGTVHKVVHMTEKKYKRVNNVGKKAVRCKKKCSESVKDGT